MPLARSPGRLPFRRPLGRMLVGLALVLTACSGDADGGPAAAPTTPPAPHPTRPGQVFNSADRLIWWLGCWDLVGLSDADLDRLHNQGVDGFACGTRHLRSEGGRYAFGPSAGVEGDDTEPTSMQRGLLEADLGRRLAERDMKLYLGFYLASNTNTATPLADWFDDASWDQGVLPDVSGLATAARELGATGLALDQELYPTRDGEQTATWNWDYPGNQRPEAEVRAQAGRRGEQVMGAVVGAFPGAELLVYATRFPETFHELVQERVNATTDANVASLHIDFWDGMTSVEGYGTIRFLDAIYYKVSHLPGVGWDDAFAYDANRTFAMLSRRLSRWDLAASKVAWSPFAWISEGPADFAAARSVDHVTEQLEAMRRWGMEREFANYVYDSLDRFDYDPYVPAIHEASRPGVVDAEPPGLTLTEPEPGAGDDGDRATVAADGDTVTLRGASTDNFAIRSVMWSTDHGDEGAASMEWEPVAGDLREGFDWEMAWAAEGIPVPPGGAVVTVTVEDIKGLRSSLTVEVDHRERG